MIKNNCLLFSFLAAVATVAIALLLTLPGAFPAGGPSFTLHLENITDWCYPLPGAHVISPYGHRDGRMHTGTDLKTVPADSIRAAFDGVVIMSQPFSAYGNCIQIRHLCGITTLYSHNLVNLVDEGQCVSAGQPIALAGRTGRASTEHLHFETRIAGRAFDPAFIFDHVNHCLQKCVLQFKKNGSVKRLK